MKKMKKKTMKREKKKKKKKKNKKKKKKIKIKKTKRKTMQKIIIQKKSLKYLKVKNGKNFMTYQISNINWEIVYFWQIIIYFIDSLKNLSVMEWTALKLIQMNQMKKSLNQE